MVLGWESEGKESEGKNKSRCFALLRMTGLLGITDRQARTEAGALPSFPELDFGLKRSFSGMPFEG